MYIPQFYNVQCHIPPPYHFPSYRCDLFWFQIEAGWIGFYATIAGIGAGLILARCADLFGGRMKALLLVLFFGAAGCFLWFSLLCLRMIEFEHGKSVCGLFLVCPVISTTIPIL